MTTRRRFLAGLGTGVAGALAGCSGTGGLLTESEDHLEPADLDGWTPDSILMSPTLPFTLPPRLFELHETRAKDLLDTVPPEPDIPNEIIRNRILDDRDRVETRIEEGPDATTPVGRLKDWNRLRTEAAELFGAYRAATGSDDASIVDKRREGVRMLLADFEATIDYSARSPLEAVLVFAPIEDRLDKASAEIPPDYPYPDDPAANVGEAGRAYRSVEAAAAALDDARGMKDAYTSAREKTNSQWSELTETLRWLEVSVERTRSRRVPNPSDTDPDTLFEYDIGGVERHLFREGRASVRYKAESVRESRENGRIARGIVDAGQSLAHIAAFDATILAIRDGTIPEAQSIESLKTSARNAFDSVQKLPTPAAPYLSAAIGKPAILQYKSGVDDVDERRFFPEYAEASFRYAALVAKATPDAVEFLAERIDD